MTDPFLCEATIRHATAEDPPEHCPNEALDSSDYCPEHDPDALYDEEVRRAEVAREASL